MTFPKRLRLYLSGFFIGVIFIVFAFGNKIFSWSYFPNDRVLAEIQLKIIEFSPQSLNVLKNKKISKNYIKDTVLVKGKINFDKSNAQASPCPYYFLYYGNMEIKFTKCKDTVVINYIN